MSATDDKQIDVKVKASTAELGPGLADARAQVSSSVAYIRESFAGLGDVVERIKAPFLAIAGIMAGGALFKETVEKADDLAISLEHASAKTGMSVEALSKLRFAGEETDVSFDALTHGMQKLALSMEEASTPTSLSARAFQTLGIATTDANGKLRPISDVLADLAEKFSHMPDGATKTALAMNVLGRNAGDLLPLLSQGPAAIKAWGDEAERLGDVMDEQTKDRIAAYHRAMVELKALFEGVAIQVASVLAPVLKQLGESFTSSESGATKLKSALSPLGETAHQISAFIIQLSGYANALGAALNYVADTASENGIVLHDVLTGQFGDAKKEWQSFSDKLQADSAAIPKALADMRANLAALNGPAPAAPHGGGDGGDTPSISGGGAGAAIKLPHMPDISAAAVKIFQDQKKVADQTIDMQREHANAGLALLQEEIDRKHALGQISDQEALAQQRLLIDQQYAADRAALDNKLELAQTDIVEQARIHAQMQALADQHTLALQKNTDAAAIAIKNRWVDVFSTITNALQTAFNGVIQGTQTLGQAISGLARSIVLEFASMQAKRLATHIAAELGMTQATAAGTAARSGLDWAAALQSVAATAWRAIKNIATYAAEAIAASYAAIASIPFVGPFMAPAVAAGIGFAVLSQVGKIASAAGGYDIPAGVNPMTQLHAREMVLPAHLADVVRGMAGQGGGAAAGSGGGETYHVTINAVDSKSFETLCRNNPRAMALGVKAAARDGHLGGGVQSVV